MIRALSLDLWDTLIEAETGPLEPYTALKLEALRSVLNRAKPLTSKDFLETYLKVSKYKDILSPKLFPRLLAALHGYDPSSQVVEEAVRAYEKAAYSYKPRPLEGSQALLEYAKKKGLKVAIVTNTSFSAKAVAKMLENAGLLQYVDYIVTSADTEVIKPNPRIFQLALRALGVSASEVVHVGDSCVGDAVGAYLVGIKPILLARSEETAQLCQGIPLLAIVKNLGEVVVVLEKLLS